MTKTKTESALENVKMNKTCFLKIYFYFNLMEIRNEQQGKNVFNFFDNNGLKLVFEFCTAGWIVYIPVSKSFKVRDLHSTYAYNLTKIELDWLT